MPINILDVKQTLAGQRLDLDWLEIPAPLIQLEQIIEFRISGSYTHGHHWKDLVEISLSHGDLSHTEFRMDSGH